MSASLYAVVVTFRVKPMHHSEFREAAVANAFASLNEPGCRTFDICEARIGQSTCSTSSTSIVTPSSITARRRTSLSSTS